MLWHQTWKSVKLRDFLLYLIETLWLNKYILLQHLITNKNIVRSFWKLKLHNMGFVLQQMESHVISRLY